MRRRALKIDSLEEAWRTWSRLASYASGRRAYRLLKMITLYHRIQASAGLKEAVNLIERILIDEAPDNVEVYSFRYTGKAGPEWLNLPAGWDVYDAWIEVQGMKYTYTQHPTLPAAHTPPSDGTIHGNVVRIGDPLDEREYEKNRDKIILVTRHHRIAYRLAAENGVPAVLLADPSKHHDSFPYIGLFLTRVEAEKYSTVAATIPWRMAEGLEGKSISMRVDSDLGGPGELPVLAAWIGDKDGEGPLLAAHICHPAPGANDNASGSSAALEAFLALASAIEEGALREPDYTIRLALIPEYTGSILGMEGWLGNLAAWGLNLDMVGRAGEYSPEPRLVYSPVTAGPSRAGDVYYDVLYSTEAGMGIDYYMAGSDHDVLLAYGRDAVMINQWPDTYYHTDSDDADTISVERLEKAARNAAATIYLLATGYQPTGLSRSRLVEEVIGGHIKRGEVEAARLAASILPLRYNASDKLEGAVYDWTPVRDDRLIARKIPVYAGLLTLSLDPPGMAEYTRRLEAIGLPRDLISEVFIAAGRGYRVDRLHSELAAVYGVRGLSEKLEALLELLAEYGMISLS